MALYDHLHHIWRQIPITAIETYVPSGRSLGPDTIVTRRRIVTPAIASTMATAIKEAIETAGVHVFTVPCIFPGSGYHSIDMNFPKYGPLTIMQKAVSLGIAWMVNALIDTLEPILNQELWENTVTEDYTPLHLAAQSGEMAVVEIVMGRTGIHKIPRCPNVNHVSKFGVALQYAVVIETCHHKFIKKFVAAVNAPVYITEKLAMPRQDALGGLDTYFSFDPEPNAVVAMLNEWFVEHHDHISHYPRTIKYFTQ
jgi:hypothetical protein